MEAADFEALPEEDKHRLHRRKKPYLGHHKTASILAERVKHRSKSKKLKVYAKKQKSLGKVIGELKNEVGELKKAVHSLKANVLAMRSSVTANVHMWGVQYFSMVAGEICYWILKKQPKVAKGSHAFQGLEVQKTIVEIAACMGLQSTA